MRSRRRRLLAFAGCPQSYRPSNRITASELRCIPKVDPSEIPTHSRFGCRRDAAEGIGKLMKSAVVLLAALTAPSGYPPTMPEKPVENPIEVVRFGEWGAACFKDGRACSVGSSDGPLFFQIGLDPARPQPETALALDWQQPYTSAQVTIEGSAGYRKSLQMTSMLFFAKAELDQIAHNSTIQITFAAADKRETIAVETDGLIEAINHSLAHLRRTGHPHPWAPYQRAAK